MAFEPKTTDANPDHAQAVNVDATEKLIKLAGEAFNISSGITTWREFMGHYGKLCGKKPKGLPLIIARLMAFANKVPGITTPIDQGFSKPPYKHFSVFQQVQKSYDLIIHLPKNDSDSILLILKKNYASTSKISFDIITITKDA